MNEYYRSSRPELYRSRSGMILGVFQGLANYFNLSIFWMRVIAVAFLIFTGFWPMVGLYLLAALLMKPEPVLAIKTPDDQEFYNSYTASRTMALHRLKKTFENLERRLRRLENAVTNKEFDWERRLNQN